MDITRLKYAKLEKDAYNKLGYSRCWKNVYTGRPVHVSDMFVDRAKHLFMRLLHNICRRNKPDNRRSVMNYCLSTFERSCYVKYNAVLPPAPFARPHASSAHTIGSIHAACHCQRWRYICGDVVHPVPVGRGLNKFASKFIKKSTRICLIFHLHNLEKLLRDMFMN